MATAKRTTTSNRSTTTPSNATSRASPAQVAQAKANAKATAPAQAPAQATAPAMGAPVPAATPKALRYTPGPLPTHVQVAPGRGRYNAAGAANAYSALVASGGVVAVYLANCAAYKAAGQACNGPVPTLRYFLAHGVCVAVAAPASVAQAS